MNKQPLFVRFLTLASLTLSLSGSAQQGESPALLERLEAVTGKGVQEKVFVHTDKTTYMAGEILWFKVYHVDAVLHRPLDLSKVAYIDILDKANNPVAQAKISLTGPGAGSIHLPLSLTTGAYKLRGYTAWMKNAGPGTYFEQAVAIINPLKTLEPEKTAGTPAYAVTFFPEGGDLVEGLESRLAFKITDKTGRGVEGSGVVVTGRGDTVARFTTHKFGIGSFSFLPQKGQQYKALVTLPGGGQAVHSLPEALAEGYTLRVSEASDGRLAISVQSSVPAQEGRYVYLLTHTRGVAKGSDKALLTNGAAVFSVDRSRLGEGVSQFTLFDKEGQPVGERLHFKRPSQGLAVSAQSDAGAYGSRRKVALAIQSKDKEGRAAPASLSLSVYRLDSLQRVEAADIHSYLWLTSDLTGYVESPHYYLGAPTPEVEKATDLLMLSHGWRRFNWKSAPARRAALQYPPEYNGHLVTARVIDSRSGAPAPGVPVFLSVPGLYFRVYTANSDAQGLVRFELKDVYGAVQLVLQANLAGENPYRFELVSPFAAQYTAQPGFPFTLPTEAALLEHHSIAMQAQNVYRGDSLRRFAQPVLSDTLPFYGKSVNSYELDKYTRFTTMEEVLREYVREINVALRGGNLHLRMLDLDRQIFFEEDVLVLVDGVPLVNKNKIFSYDPHKVRKLEVIPRGYLLGPAHFNGVASFTTYAGNLEGLTLDPGVLLVNYESLQLAREFYAPVYETEEALRSRIPDFRTTLYWKPDVATDEKGASALSFYTSDMKGQYMGVLQGMDQQGRAISTTFTFTVQ